jgi:cell division transport system permease protein
MKINTFFYSIHQGLRNIGRNKMFSLASIATMAACIFMFGLFYIIVTNFTNMVKEAEESVAVTVFFDEGISQERIDEIGEEINKRVEVSESKYISAEEAWEEVKADYFEGNEEIAASFEGDNPVANSAHYEIYLNDVSMQNSLVVFLENLDGVRSVKQSEMVAETLSDFNRLIGYVSAGIILILLCVAVFLISNTVTVGISVRKEEIAIMKLIGASDFLVRAPFIVEGMVIGLIGAFIPLALLYVLYGRIVIYISEKFSFIGSMFSFLPARTIFEMLVPVAILLGVGIGFIGSTFTIRKHLKV